jgi:hypothetical protein
VSSQHSRQGVEEHVEVDGFGEDAKDAHAQGLVEQVVGQVLGEEDRGRGPGHLAHDPNDLESAELRHLLVEDGDVNLTALDEVQGFASGAGWERGDAVRLEQPADGVLPERRGRVL